MGHRISGLATCFGLRPSGFGIAGASVFGFLRGLDLRGRRPVIGAMPFAASPGPEPVQPKRGARVRLPAVGLAVWLAAAPGCRRAEEPGSTSTESPAAAATLLARQLAERDTTVWRDELLARTHEKTFV